MEESAAEQLNLLHAEIRGCRRCVDAGFIPLANPVFRGRSDHRLMVIGQAPGERGHLNAVPYAGATGKTLRSWIVQAGFAEDDLYQRFYLTSVTKCFPGPSTSGKGDRAPSPAEVRLCGDHLDREIRSVRPEIVLSLGRLSATGLVGNAPLDQLVGTLRWCERAGHRFQVLPLPHPSGVSHWLNNPANRARLQEGLALLSALKIERGW
jgi:uracil-DNA glycosylase family 4